MNLSASFNVARDGLGFSRNVHGQNLDREGVTFTGSETDFRERSAKQVQKIEDQAVECSTRKSAVGSGDLEYGSRGRLSMVRCAPNLQTVADQAICSHDNIGSELESTTNGTDRPAGDLLEYGSKERESGRASIVRFAPDVPDVHDSLSSVDCNESSAEELQTITDQAVPLA